MKKLELGGVYYNPDFKVFIKVTGLRLTSFDYVVLRCGEFYYQGEIRGYCAYNSAMAIGLLLDKSYDFYSQLVNLK